MQKAFEANKDPKLKRIKLGLNQFSDQQMRDHLNNYYSEQGTTASNSDISDDSKAEKFKEPETQGKKKHIIDLIEKKEETLTF